MFYNTRRRIRVFSIMVRNGGIRYALDRVKDPYWAG